MVSSNDNKQEFIIGIDGGGTKCKAVVVSSNNEILGTGIAGPGNPLHGFKQATQSITESANLAIIDAGLTHLSMSDFVVGVGLAGVNLPVLFEQMSQWQHPFKQMFLATDLLIACLGAHQGEDGAVIITGTGSCGYAFVDGEPFIVGAHGFPHGDKGSGAWFGLQAVKQVLLSLDGLSEQTSLNEKILKFLNVNNDVELVEEIAGKPAAYYAQLAQFVFGEANQGDVVAIEIVKEGADYINRVARRLWQRNPPCMAHIGGLTPILKPWLAQDIREALCQPLSPPEIGAVLFARQQLLNCFVKDNLQTTA